MWIAAGLVLVGVGILVGFFIARSQADDQEAQLIKTRQELGVVRDALAQAEERNWNYYRENQALLGELEHLRTLGQTATTTTEPPSGPKRAYGDGIYLVGEDISAGTYDGVVIGEQGYWARLSGIDGLVSQIVANAVPRGPFTLTIVETDRAVELRGVEITAH